MSDRIYILSESGDTEPLAEERYKDEDALQALIADHPELLAGEQIDPDVPRRWLLISREIGIAPSAELGERWALDHLFLDQDARPTLVEVKRGDNSEVRRRVVGQMLDYAAHAADSWSAEGVRKRFESEAGSESAAREQLAARLGVGSGMADDAGAYEAFWMRVATNLRDENLRLLFVADHIPDVLASIVEFLNRHMGRIEVLAVELKQFQAQGTRAIVPRVIGRSRKLLSSGMGSRLTLEQIIEGFAEGEVRDAARQLIDRSRAAGASFEPGSLGTSIRVQCRLWGQPVTVAWLFPSEVGWMRTKHFTFGAGILDYDPPPPVALREALLQYARQFEDDPYTRDASSQGVVAWYVEPADAAKHIDVLTERLDKVLSDLKAL